MLISYMKHSVGRKTGNWKIQNKQTFFFSFSIRKKLKTKV